MGITGVSGANPNGVFTIRETAWVLGVNESEVWRMIRVGELPVVRRRSRLVVPAYALARLLPSADEGRA